MRGCVKAHELYEDYARWCQLTGRPPRTQTKFGIEMRKLYCREDRRGRRVYVRIRLVD